MEFSLWNAPCASTSSKMVILNCYKTHVDVLKGVLAECSGRKMLLRRESTAGAVAGDGYDRFRMVIAQTKWVHTPGSHTWKRVWNLHHRIESEVPWNTLLRYHTFCKRLCFDRKQCQNDGTLFEDKRGWKMFRCWKKIEILWLLMQHWIHNF
jgi:hypothetical protein